MYSSLPCISRLSIATYVLCLAVTLWRRSWRIGSQVLEQLGEMKPLNDIYVYKRYSSLSSVVHQPCLDPQPTCCQELEGALGLPPVQKLVGGCQHNCCLCCHQRKQSRRMCLTVCSASWQPQSAEFMTFVHFRCACRLQQPVGSLHNVVCACFA